MYRKSFEIIGYTYDADVHCVECATKYVGLRERDGIRQAAGITHNDYLGFTDLHGDAVTFEDSEGNEVHPIFLDNYGDLVYEDDDGEQYPPRCGDCGEELE